MAVIALDLGGTKLAGALFTRAGKPLGKRLFSLDGRKGRQVGKLICDAARELRKAALSQHLTLQAVGISVPGISYSRTGRVWAPNIPGWTNYPLRAELSHVLGSSTIPVRVESDRACYILGETWRGAARGSRNAIFLAVGTGIGAGILSEGQVLRGAHDSAGAIGWLALDRPFRREYISCGCFEHHASGEGLAKVARELERDPHKSASRRAQALSGRALFAAYDRGDAVARRTLQQAIEFWGMGVANLVSLFNPEQIVFGGGVFGPAQRFLPQIYREAKKWAQPIAIKQVKLIASKLGADAGLYGAARVALQAVE